MEESVSKEKLVTMSHECLKPTPDDNDTLWVQVESEFIDTSAIVEKIETLMNAQTACMDCINDNSGVTMNIVTMVSDLNERMRVMENKITNLQTNIHDLTICMQKLLLHISTSNVSHMNGNKKKSSLIFRL